MNITEWSIRNDRVTISAGILIILLGISSYFSLPKAQDPGFTIRVATVTTSFPGASAERVEKLVTDKIEEKIQEMPELDQINSESTAGLSVINVTFQDHYTELQPIFDDLRQKVEDVTADLPSGAMPPVVNDEFGDTFGHVYSLTGEGYTPRELHEYADKVRNVLLLEDNVAKVALYGEIEETIYIEYNNATLTALDITPTQISSALKAVNILSSAGEMTIGREKITAEPTGNFETIEDLQDTQISIPNSDALIRLGDIASVYRDYQDPVSEIVRINGKPGISITISLKDGGNILSLGERLTELMPRLEAELPVGVELQPMYLQSEITRASVNSFVNNIFQSVGIILLVMLVSLGLRTGVVVASLIPMVILSTFIIMPYFELSIDQISLAALIIALGLLVDNAIVIAEAVILRRENGESPLQAAINAANEMKVPLLISSLTTVAAFAPIGLGAGSAGEFTQSIFYVVGIALIVSWIFSMTIVPLMTRYIKVQVKDSSASNDHYDTRFYRAYRQVLTLFLKRPFVLISILAVTFIGALKGMDYLPKMFIPASNEPLLTVKMTLPSGTDISATQQAVVNFDQFIEERLSIDGTDPTALGIRDRTAYIGVGGPRFVLGYNPSNKNEAEANMIINVNNSESLDPMKTAIEEYFFLNEPDAQIQVKRLAQGPPFDYPIEIKISGAEHQTLFELAANVKEKLWQTPGVTIITDNWGEQTKKAVVNIDQAKALRAGLSSLDIADSLKGSLSGFEATEFREGVDVIPVVIRAQGQERDDIARLENQTVFSQSSNASVPLSQVIKPQIVWEPGRLMRLDRELSIKIQVQIADGLTSEEVSRDFIPWLEEYAQTWPVGYSYQEGGEANASAEGMQPIIDLLPYAFGAIVLLLLLQFNSFRKMAIVLATIPLGLIGVIFGLNVAQSYFGFFTFLGVISLAGIVINNAIVLIDRIKIEIEENGLPECEAIVQAAQQRTRPILLTTATTIGGMLPLWFGGGDMFSTLAIAILFGLMFATVVTLLLVPVLYGLLFRVRFN